MITGNKIILRRQIDEDAAFFERWYKVPEIMKECAFAQPITRAELIESFHSDDASRDWYTIIEKNTGKVIGETGLLRIDLQWHRSDLTIISPDPADQGKGYGTEAVKLMLQQAFESHKLNRVALATVAFNDKAIDFYKKIGFKQEGIEEQGFYCNGKFYDFIMFRILRSEYNGGKKND